MRDRTAERVVDQLGTLHSGRIEDGIGIDDDAARESARDVRGLDRAIFRPWRENKQAVRAARSRQRVAHTLNAQMFDGIIGNRRIMRANLDAFQLRDGCDGR